MLKQQRLMFLRRHIVLRLTRLLLAPRYEVRQIYIELKAMAGALNRRRMVGKISAILSRRKSMLWTFA